MDDAAAAQDIIERFSDALTSNDKVALATAGLGAPLDESVSARVVELFAARKPRDEKAAHAKAWAKRMRSVNAKTDIMNKRMYGTMEENLKEKTGTSYTGGPIPKMSESQKKAIKLERDNKIRGVLSKHGWEAHFRSQSYTTYRHPKKPGFEIDHDHGAHFVRLSGPVKHSSLGNDSTRSHADIPHAEFESRMADFHKKK